MNTYQYTENQLYKLCSGILQIAGLDTSPTEDQIACVRKWLYEWKATPAAVIMCTAMLKNITGFDEIDQKLDMIRQAYSGQVLDEQLILEEAIHRETPASKSKKPEAGPTASRTVPISGNQHQIIPFGKYKGQPLEVLRTDPEYCEWLTGQSWLVERYPQINTLIVNNFTAAEDTPTHNMLQARFLDNDLCESVCMYQTAINGQNMQNYQEFIRNRYRAKYEDCMEKYRDEKTTKQRQSENSWITIRDNSKAKVPCPLGQADDSYSPASLRCRQSGCTWAVPGEDCYCCNASYNGGNVIVESTEFEVQGWDVRIKARFIGGSLETGEDLRVSCFVEIKPSLGDDYPSILRQMKANLPESKANKLFVLVYDVFTATSVSIRQVRKIFNQSGFKVVSFTELEGICQE